MISSYTQLYNSVKTLLGECCEHLEKNLNPWKKPIQEAKINFERLLQPFDRWHTKESYGEIQTLLRIAQVFLSPVTSLKEQHDQLGNHIQTLENLKAVLDFQSKSRSYSYFNTNL